MLTLLLGGRGSAAREAAPKDCLVRIFLGTADLCDRAANRNEMRRLEAPLRERDDAYSVRFVSKNP